MVALAGLLGIATWLLADHYPPWRSFLNEFAAFLALWLLLVFCVTRAGRSIEIPHWALAVLSVAAIPPIQYTSGHIYFAGDAWMATAYLSGLAIAIAVGFLFAQRDSRRSAKGLALFFSASGALTFVLVLYQWLGLSVLGGWITPLPPGVRPLGNIEQPNHVATVFCLGVASVIYLRETGSIRGVPAFIAALLLVFGITLTQARVPWITAGILTLWWFWKRHSLTRTKGWAIGLGIAFFAATIVFWPQGESTAITPATPQRADLKQAGTHILNWTEMLRAVREAPVLGYGWNQVSVAHVQAARERHTYAEMLTHSHNLLLDLIIWNGLPIGLLLIAAIAYWLATRSWRCSTPEAWFALLAIASVGVHHMFEYPLDYAYFLLPVGLLVGLVEANVKGRTYHLSKAVLWSVVAVYAGFLTLIWREYRTIESDYRLMRFEERRIGPLKAAQPAPDVILLTQLREDLRMARTLAHPGMSEAELEWMRKITYRYPWYSSLFRYAVSLALNGRREQASVEFRRLYDIYGAKPYARAKDAVALLAETKYPELKDWRLPPP